MQMIVGQLWYALASFLWGFFLMFIYDFVLVSRGKKRRGKIRLFLEDWLFWTVAAVFVFQMIFERNNGVLRTFFVVAFLAGMAGYRKVVKERVQHGISVIFAFLCRPYVWISKKIVKIRKKSLKS